MEINTTLFRKEPRFDTRLCKAENLRAKRKRRCVSKKKSCGRIRLSLIVKAVVSKNIYFLFFQIIRSCAVPDHHHFERSMLDKMLQINMRINLRILSQHDTIKEKRS